jgi:hypothetical protein
MSYVKKIGECITLKKLILAEGERRYREIKSVRLKKGWEDKREKE